MPGGGGVEGGGAAECSLDGHGLGPLDLNKTLVIHTLIQTDARTHTHGHGVVELGRFQAGKQENAPRG